MSVRIPWTMTVINRMDYVLIPMGPTTVTVIWDTVVMASTALVSRLMHVYFEKGHRNKSNYPVLVILALNL